MQRYAASMRPSDITDGIRPAAGPYRTDLTGFNEAVGYYRRNLAGMSESGTANKLQ